MVGHNPKADCKCSNELSERNGDFLELGMVIEECECNGNCKRDND